MGSQRGSDRFAQWRGVSRRSRLGILLLAALLVPVGVVTVVGVFSLRNEAVTREHLLRETYRQVAEIVAARLNDRIDTLEAELAGELAEASASPSREALIGALRAAQESRPWLRPAVLVRSDGTAVYPAAAAGLASTAVSSEASMDNGAAAEFWRAFEAADEAELREGDLSKAIQLYTRAVEKAPSAAHRTNAFNRLARCEYNAGSYREAIATYEMLIDAASVSSPEQATLALMAHRQRVAAAGQLHDDDLASRATLDLLAFLTANAAVVDPHVAAAYRSEVDTLLASAPPGGEPARRLEDLREAERTAHREEVRREALLETVRATNLPAAAAGSSFAIGDRASARVPDTGATGPEAMPDDGHSHLDEGPRPIIVTPIGDRRVLLAHEWRAEQVQDVLAEVLAGPGPWEEASVALTGQPIGADELSPIPGTPAIPEGAAFTASAIDLLPSWRVVAFPPEGSVADLVAQSVRRYALLLGLALASVVVAVALGARSVSRELSLVRLRAQFVSSVSHELRTPLSLIRMFTESLEEGWIDEAKRADTYSRIRRETERLTGLIDNVLDFSRLESGTRTFDFADVDLNELVVEAVHRLGPEFEAAEVDCRVEAGPPTRLRADPEAIDRVLVNLLSNAVKYIGEGERRITVSSCTNGERAGFRVKDTGIGMSPDDAGKVFDRYFRADGGNARSVAGSGIGLTVSKGIVDAHGGSMEVRSAPGEGSEFTVWLPTTAETAS